MGYKIGEKLIWYRYFGSNGSKKRVKLSCTYVGETKHMVRVELESGERRTVHRDYVEKARDAGN